MDSWEFLIQKKGTRSWLPLKRRRLKIEAGIYRIVAQSCRANVDVEIRVIHRTIDEIPPKRRSQKRTCRTSKEGLMIAIPFTYIRPGFWEFRSTCEKMDEIQGKPWQEIVQLEVIPAKVPRKAETQNSPAPKTTKPSEKVVREVESVTSHQSSVTSHQSPVTSDATPANRIRQAVRPRVAEGRKGMLTKRGNAHRNQSPVQKELVQTNLGRSNLEQSDEAIAAESQPKVENRGQQEANRSQVAVNRQTAIATHAIAANLEKIEETIASKSKSQPITNTRKYLEESEEAIEPVTQQPISGATYRNNRIRLGNAHQDTNNQQPITNDAHSLLEQSIQSLEQILQQVNEPESEPQPKTQPESQPQKTLKVEQKDSQIEASQPSLSVATKDDLEGIKFPNDLSISLLQDHFIRRKDEPLLISGHVNSLDLSQTSILDSGFEGVLHYELRDPHGTELLLDVCQPLSDATIPLVFNYLLDIPTEYDTRLILGEVILEVFIDRGDGRAKKTARLASQTFSITAGLDDLLEAIANPIETEDPARVKHLNSFSEEQESETTSVNAEFLDLTKREIESRPFEPIEQQILPPKLSLSRPKKSAKTKNIDLPNFSSPPPRDSAYHTYSVSSLSPDFLDSLKNDSSSEEKRSKAENSVSPSTISESDLADNTPEEETDKIETPNLEKEEISVENLEDRSDISETNSDETSDAEYIAETDETLEEEKEDRSFQKVQMQGRFWKQINLMKVDEEVNEELVEWLQAHPVRSQNNENISENERKKNDLEETAQRLAEKAEVLQELAEQERSAALADIAEELELSEETPEVEILEKLAKEAEFLKKLAAEIDEKEHSSSEMQPDRDILRAPEIPSPTQEEEVQVAEVTIDRTNHEFVVDDEEDDIEEELAIGSALPKHDSSGLPYPVGIQSLVTSRSMPFSPPLEKNRKEVAITEIRPEFSPQKSGNLVTPTQSLIPHQLRQEILVPTPILDVPSGELSGGELVLIRVRLPAYPGSIYVKLWVQDRETRQLLDGPRAFVDFTWNNAGELETLTQLIVPVASLSIRFEAIAIDVETQRESHKAICDRTVIPPEFQQKSFEII